MGQSIVYQILSAAALVSLGRPGEVPQFDQGLCIITKLIAAEIHLKGAK